MNYRTNYLAKVDDTDRCPFCDIDVTYIPWPKCWFKGRFFPSMVTVSSRSFSNELFTVTCKNCKYEWQPNEKEEEVNLENRYNTTDKVDDLYNRKKPPALPVPPMPMMVQGQWSKNK